VYNQHPTRFSFRKREEINETTKVSTHISSKNGWEILNVWIENAQRYRLSLSLSLVTLALWLNISVVQTMNSTHNVPPPFFLTKTSLLLSRVSFT
jgi:hypothetical protein